MAQTLQGSPHQVKNNDRLRCLLKAKGIQYELGKEIITNASCNYVMSDRNEDSSLS